MENKSNLLHATRHARFDVHGNSHIGIHRNPYRLIAVLECSATLCFMLETILNLTSEQKQRIEKEVGPVRSIAGFCSDLLEATKEIPLKETFVKLLPWAVKSGEIISEVTPLAKMLVKLVDEFAKEKDPEVLGFLACSLAYQRCAALALVQQGEPRNRVPFHDSLESARTSLKKLSLSVSLKGFSLDAPVAHPFIWDADNALYLIVRYAGYSDSEWRQIQSRIHGQFRADLVEVLSHGETANRFEPFTRRLSLGDDTSRYAALNAHIERQRWIFEDRPVLNIEPFTLRDVYVDTDCGKLQWQDFLNADDVKYAGTGESFDPFSESFGGRHDLLQTVLSYLRDAKFNDAVVIQGAPGSGKSAFTLYLANVLRREGLRPLRIRLKFLDLKKNLSEALANVLLQPEEDEAPALSHLSQCSDLFGNDSIFQERTKFGEAEICPYVLIFDGWDEISVSVNEGFEIEVHRMLKNVREQFLRPRAVKVRVLLTGRPSDAVERSQFLRDKTPVLTVREYTTDQLKSYASKVRSAVEHSSSEPGVEPWPTVDWDKIFNEIESYGRSITKINLDILGLPLLAHLSIRLMAQRDGEAQPVLQDRTALYRSILDLTCVKAGKASSDSDDLLGQARIRGIELRTLLQQTAVAITAYGNESIPFRELQLRLKKSRKQVMYDAEAAGKERPLTRLMISFYFKGGRENLGCEFLHKSFREYLFAEAIVEALKEYGLKPGIFVKRAPYWRDFHTSDPRRQFSRDLSQVLCPYPLSPEVRSHIERLLLWEILRSYAKEVDPPVGLPAATFQQWEKIRECLADLWDWWGEGVHLRPQPYRDDSDNLRYSPAIVNELLDYSLPRDRSPDAVEWWPGRVVTADANVGDALCRLNAWVHSFIVEVSGYNSDGHTHPSYLTGLTTNRKWLETEGGPQCGPYQSVFRHSESSLVAFRPSGSQAIYLQNYCFRINAVGNRSESFPGGICLRHTDLRKTILPYSNLSGADLQDADLEGANLSGANLQRANLARARLTNANLSKASLGEAYIRDADLSEANFSGADLGMVDLHNAKLRKTNLSTAHLPGANLSGADLHGADLQGANLRGAELYNVILAGADLRGTNLCGAILCAADLRKADLRWADLSEANLSNANVSKANLSDANLIGANLTGVELSEARTAGTRIFSAHPYLRER